MPMHPATYALDAPCKCTVCGWNGSRSTAHQSPMGNDFDGTGNNFIAGCPVCVTKGKPGEPANHYTLQYIDSRVTINPGALGTTTDS